MSSTIAFIGNPNAGKTTLFNVLTGARAKVANYPGVTVERREASIALPGEPDVKAIDLPGLYSLVARSEDEHVASREVLGIGAARPSAVCVVVDATSLERGLYLATQLIDAHERCVIALTMTDQAEAEGTTVETEKLAQALGVPVVRVVGPKKIGLEQLRKALANALDQPPASRSLDVDRAEALRALREVFAQKESDGRRAQVLAELTVLGDAEREDDSDELRAATDSVRESGGPDLEQSIIAARYARVDEITKAVCQRATESERRRKTDRIDSILTHKVWGTLVFLLVMALIFQSLFAWSDPMIGVVENLVVALQGAATSALPPGIFRDLVVDGIIAGVGNVVVFVPQIAVLFLFISFLEDSGYLARVAFVLDRLMGGVGLSGKAFVPMLSGFACAIPAVLATRTIESWRDRVLTMIALPLTSCSARLPVYVLITAVVFDPDQTVLGFLSLGAVVLLAMYAFSVVAALGAAAVLRRTVLRGPKPALVLELPPYRIPHPGNMLRETWARVKRFLVDAGTVILAFTIILWALLSFPHDDAIGEKYDTLRREAPAAVPEEELADYLADLDAREQGEQLDHSAAGRLGHAIEPALRPIGFDWRIGVGIIGAFAAREVFVSTMGVVFGMGEVDEESEPLRETLGDARWPDGRPLFTPLTGVSLMIFFVLACQCMSTLAAIKRETGSWKWPAFTFAYMSVLAYVASLLVFQVGSLLGWGVA